jgi:hypothetical protein
VVLVIVFKLLVILACLLVLATILVSEAVAAVPVRDNLTGCLVVLVVAAMVASLPILAVLL